jgi:hypothetical protein
MLTLVNQSAGVVNGNDSTSALTVNATIVNSGVLEGTTAPGLVIIGNVSNSKLIEALGTSAAVVISGGTVSNASAGTILASGLGAHVDLLDGTIVSSGTLKTSGFNAVIDTASGGTATFAGGTVASGSVVDVVDGSTLVLSGTIVNSGTIELTASGDQTSLQHAKARQRQRPHRRRHGTGSRCRRQRQGDIRRHQRHAAPRRCVALYRRGRRVQGIGPHRAQIGFGAETTLGYAANAAGTGGTLRVSDGVRTASIALLGNYMAASFATAADGHGGTLITEADQAAHTPLASPRHA